jgi:hypothetical protein
MMKTPTLFLLTALLCGTWVLHAAPSTSESATPTAIARDGKALLGITVSEQASEETKKTAAELAGFLKRITGAEFAVAAGKGPAGITLGTLAQFPDESLKEPLAVREGYDGVEAFAIRSDGGGIRLLGNTDAGVSHAAYRFLELLGCRWFFQGPTWEIVPRTPDLAFSLNENGRPDIWSRDIWFGRTTQKWEKGDPDPNAAFAAWAKGNRMGMSLKFFVIHNWHAIPMAFKEDGLPFKQEFDAHPEYFALVDGKRTPPQLCVANGGLQKLVTRYATKFFEKNPEAHMVSLDTADQGGWCTCPECAKLGPYPCQPFFLANVVAKELQKVHPGKYVGLLAYSWHSDAPPFTLEPNVYVQLTAGMNASKFSFDELFKLWTERCRHLGIYEYYSYWEMDKAMLPGAGPQNNFETLGPRMRNFVTNRVASISGQAANSWGANGLGYYLAAKLMWDSTLDTKALRKDFYEKAFGPAAAPMECYFERLNLANKPLPGASLLRQCLGDLEEATPLAAGRPDVLARITQLKESLVYSAIGLKVNAAADDAEVKKQTLEWFTWSYRTRNNYMNDWITFRSTVGRPAAEKLGEKTWFWRNTGDNPWKTNAPVTPQDLEARLGVVKAELGELPTTPEVRFSDRYVLVKTERAGGGASKQLFSGKATYLLASLKGEPLRFTVTKRETGWIEKPDARYSLVAQDGTPVLEGGVPTGRHELELKVPAAGIYRFTCTRGYTGWEVEFPRELPHALVFARGERCHPSAIASSWFYVPKGTQEIVMYTASPSAPGVRAPDNRVAHKGTSLGNFVPIKVKPGEDGKLWSLSGRPANLWFFNVPSVLSFNAAWAFVPEEVAKKDGLDVVLR